MTPPVANSATGPLFALASLLLLRPIKSLVFREWEETAKLLGGQSWGSDWRGRAVAIDNGTLAVGQDRGEQGTDDSPGDYSAFVSVYELVDGEWSLEQTLMATDSEAYFFGDSIVISDGTIVVGAWWDDDIAMAAGSVYVYSKDRSGSWTEQTKLLPRHDTDVDDLFVAHPANHNCFGRDLGMHKSTLLVGASLGAFTTGRSGSAYVYSFLDGVWTEQAKLTAGGKGADSFGAAVAIHGETLVVGSKKGDESVYVFQLQDGRWTEQARLQHWSKYPRVALERGTLFLSQIIDGGSAAGPTISGQVHVYRQKGGSWVLQATLSPSDDSTSSFGHTLAVQDGLLAVGAFRAVYLFEESSTGHWTQRARLVASDASSTGEIANHIDLDDGVVVAAGSCVGCSAYVFERRNLSAERRNLSGPMMTRLVGAVLVLSVVLMRWTRTRAGRTHPRDRNE